MKKIIFGLLSIVLILSLTSCGVAQVMNVPNQSISKKASSNDVYKAIQRAGIGLGWKIQKTNNNTVLATLSLRSHLAVVTINYTQSSYSINYKSSIALRYSPQDNTIHKNYNGWIQNLNNAIQAQLSLVDSSTQVQSTTQEAPKTKKTAVKIKKETVKNTNAPSNEW